MKVSLRFLFFLMAIFALADFFSLLCRAPFSASDYADSAMLGDDDAMGQAPVGLGGDYGDDDEDEHVGVTLINHTGSYFYVYRVDPDDGETTNLLVSNGGSVTMMDDEPDFYINTPVPGRELGLSSFGINDGNLNPGAEYTVELYDEVDGHALFDAHYHPVWHMRFTEVVPAQDNHRNPHVFTIVRPK